MKITATKNDAPRMMIVNPSTLLNLQGGGVGSSKATNKGNHRRNGTS